jgi:hypothetical protein
MIKLKPTDSVDQSFVAIVEQIINNTLQLHRLAEVFIVLIDNWFDHKWLEFASNKNESDASGWRPKLMLPPFEPSRVVSQSYFHTHSSAPLLYEPSSSNPLHILPTNRSLSQICPSGAFVWYSNVGEKADRGSLMVYLNNNGRGSAWYASFVKNPGWQMNKVKGASKREFAELMTAAVMTDGI